MNQHKVNRSEVDPVCGMQVDPEKTDHRADYDGRTYFFCAEGCRKEFENQPQKYLNPPPKTQRKGFWKRYLERLNRITDGKPPSCCQ
jgi:YHS domain-containing protein